MSPLWEADREVSLEMAAALVAEQFPELAPVRAEWLGEGWDNTAVLVNETYVFRFPRRQLALQFFENELRLLPAISERLPLAVPTPIFFGQPSGRYEWPFAGYRFIEGRTACEVALDESQRIELATPLAEFLAALASIGPDEASRLGAKGDPLGRLDPAKRVPQARENLSRASSLGLIDNADVFHDLIDWAKTHLPAREPEPVCLVHGDLYAAHLLVDARGSLTGVIDWGDVHVGNPAVDLAIAHSLLPPSAREIFRRSYGPIDNATWQAARFRALYHTLMVAVYAYETARSAMLREAKIALRYITEH